MSSKTNRTTAFLIAAIAALILAFPGVARGDDEASEEIPAPVEKALVGSAEHELDVAPSGDYEVDPAVGRPLPTHGPDLAATLEAGPSTGFRIGDPERKPLCASDYYQHVIYAVPRSKTDRYSSSVAEIRSIVERMNSVLNQNSIASGGGSADYKVLCNIAGEIEVTRLVVSGSSFSDVVSSARAQGLNRANVDYTIFLDDTSSAACGVGSYTPDQSLSVSNANNSGGDYAVTYRACWYNETPMHENAHNQGAVQYGAPHSTGTGGHCWDEYDVMCYAPDGGDKHQGGVRIFDNCRDRNYFDCGYNDYFDSRPEPGEYLSSHWNLGSALNRYISFGPGGGGGETSDPDDPAEVGSLPARGVVHGKAGEIGSWRYWRFEARSNMLQRISLLGRGGDLDLYVRRGAKPTLGSFDCRSFSWRANESCSVRSGRGTYFVGVRTEATGAGSEFTLRRAEAVLKKKGKKRRR